jgi:hypothetical protein
MLQNTSWTGKSQNGTSESESRHGIKAGRININKAFQLTAADGSGYLN